MGKKNSKATISDVAKQAGVSNATVSNYLNHRLDMMKPETSERISMAIQDLGYVPSLSARRLSAKAKSKTVCLVIPRNLSSLASSMYYPVVFASIGKETAKYGYSTIIYVRNPEDSEESMNYLLGISQSFVDGFIIFDLSQDTRFFKEFEKNNIPYVCVGQIDGYREYNFVATDHGASLKEAMEYLIGLGHQKIMLCTEDRKDGVVKNVRRKAYMDCMKAHHITYSGHILSYNEEIMDENMSEEDERVVIEDLKRILSDPEAPTAVIISANLLYYLKKSMRELGLRTPDDISIVALEYFENFRATYPGFEYKNYTRVDSVVSNVAKVAFQKLIEKIEGTSQEKFVAYLESAKLVVGKTTRACPSPKEGSPNE